MTVKELLARARLEYGSPLECELLLRHVLGLDRVQLYLSLDRELASAEEEAFWKVVARWQEGEPLAYITGHREFYGLDFYVDRRVLIPRPETELLVEQALGLAAHYRVAAIAEIGTGSGAVAISLARNLPGIKIFATDSSADALEVARLNCLRHGMTERVTLLLGDMLAPLPGPVDLIIANLPYVRSSELPSTGEPRQALDGGPDGLDPIRRIGEQIKRLQPRAFLLLEVGLGQAAPVQGLLRHLFPGARLTVSKDLAGIERVIGMTPASVT